jgi:hypothetical protein
MVKGQAGIELLAMGAMVVLTMFIVGLLPTASVKYNLDKETIFEYKYNKVQHTLLTLFSTTHEDPTTHDEKKVSELIAEKFAINKPSDLDFLKPILDKEIESKCYQLNVSDKILLSVDGCNPSYWINSTIVLPYKYNVNKQECLAHGVQEPSPKFVEEIEVGIE